MDIELVQAERREGILWITLNRPDKANAMTVAMSQRVNALLREGCADAEVRAIVLTGAGERVFCGGVDVREKPADGDMAAQRERRSHASAALQDTLMDADKPVVVVLNGSATGGGAMIALLADACIAVDTAEIGMPEIDLGIATFSGANILEVAGGRTLAADLVQSGRRMPAAEAAARGLLRAVVPRDALAQAATGLAALLGAKPPKVFADNKRWLNRRLKAALAEAREEHARHRAAAAAAAA